MHDRVHVRACICVHLCVCVPVCTYVLARVRASMHAWVPSGEWEGVNDRYIIRMAIYNVSEIFPVSVIKINIL